MPDKRYGPKGWPLAFGAHCTAADHVMLCRQTMFDDLSFYDVTTKEWCYVETSGNKPCARSGMGKYSGPIRFISCTSLFHQGVGALHMWGVVALVDFSRAYCCLAPRQSISVGTLHISHAYSGDGSRLLKQWVLIAGVASDGERALMVGGWTISLHTKSLPLADVWQYDFDEGYWIQVRSLHE